MRGKKGCECSGKHGTYWSHEWQAYLCWSCHGYA